MFLEKLKLQLFAANDEELEDGPDFSEQDDDINVDEEIEEEEPTIDNEEETDDEEIDEEPGEEIEEETEEQPFMVFKSKEEHQQYMDSIIGKRLGDYRETKEKLTEYDNMLSVLKDYFEVEDIDDLKKKTDELLDDIAYQRGTTKQALLKQQKEQQELRELRALQEQQRQEMFVNAFNTDCNKLAKLNPDLYGEIKPDELIQNKEFLQMLGQGIPFKRAYDALHVEEIIMKQTKKAKKNVIDDVKAKGTRIKENAAGKSKAAVTKIDVSKMTDDEIAELEERAARGERISF